MFSLSKWYGDCIAENGDTVILYYGRLRWGNVALNYSSLLDDRGGASYSLRANREPHVSGGLCCWSSKALRFDARWKALQAPLSDVVYSGPDGRVEWSCGWPKAHGRIEVEGRPPVEGCGYVEHLRLTIAPWHLPIRCLRWGHVTAGDDCAVWIDWTGEYSRSVVFLNGVRQTAPVVSDEVVRCDGGVTVELDRGRCLREGRIDSTALGAIQTAAKVFPASILALEERKWRSRALLQRPDGSVVRGWAIHEKVVWP